MSVFQQSNPNEGLTDQNVIFSAIKGLSVKVAMLRLAALKSYC